VDEAQALSRLSGILARPEFRPEPPPAFWEQWLLALKIWVVNLVMGAFLSANDAARGRQGLVGLAVFVVAVALLSLAGVFVVRAVRLGLVGDSALAARAAAERRQRSDRLWREAHELAARGRFGEAVRALYLSALYALDEHALLRLQVGQTNREHADRLARSHPELGDAFASLVQRYDRLRYGRYPADAREFAELSGLVERARGASGPVSPGPATA
jgi:hypothetical protein